MSAAFMFAIALMYAGSALSFAVDGKYSWAALCLCWGAGNAILGAISK